MNAEATRSLVVVQTLERRLRGAALAGALGCLLAPGFVLVTGGHLTTRAVSIPLLMAALWVIIFLTRRTSMAEAAVWLLLGTLAMLIAAAAIVETPATNLDRTLLVLLPPLALLLVPRRRSPIIAASLAALAVTTTCIITLAAVDLSILDQPLALRSASIQIASLLTLGGALAVSAPQYAQQQKERAKPRTSLEERYQRQQAQVDFIRHIQHELRKYASAMEVMAPRLRDGLLGEEYVSLTLDDKISLMDDIDQTVTQLKLLIEQSYALTRGDMLSVQQRRPISLVPLLREARRDAEAYAAQLSAPISIRVELADDLHLHGDALCLKLAFYTGLANAVDAIAARLAHSDIKEFERDITIYAFHQEKTIVVRIEDTGIGFPWHLLERVAGRRFGWSTKTGGSGVGLAVLDQVAAIHGGTFRLGNRSDRAGAWVELAFPRLGA